jgi:hypothetical protein
MRKHFVYQTIEIVIHITGLFLSHLETQTAINQAQDHPQRVNNPKKEILPDLTKN